MPGSAQWRAVNACGIRLDCRSYDREALNPAAPAATPDTSPQQR
jgi:hypothetical protein